MKIRFLPHQIEKEPNHILNPITNLDMTDWPNRIIYHKVSKAAYLDVIGTLSIKYVFKGQESYLFDNMRLVVDNTSYLILNNQRCYCSYTDSETNVESLSIFFHPKVVEEVFRGMITLDDHLLDDPYKSINQPVEFFEKLYRHDNILTPLLHRLRCLIKNELGSHGIYEEYFHFLLERLLGVHRNLGKEIERLPSIRLSTRVEIYRRLHRARDFIESSFNEPISLSQMADTAYLSKYHFLRLFKQAFGETPYQYLIRRRLETAQKLLKETNSSITQISYEAGFESLNLFGKHFRQYFKISPRAYRNSL